MTGGRPTRIGGGGWPLPRRRHGRPRAPLPGRSGRRLRDQDPCCRGRLTAPPIPPPRRRIGSCSPRRRGSPADPATPPLKCFGRSNSSNEVNSSSYPACRKPVGAGVSEGGAGFIGSREGVTAGRLRQGDRSHGGAGRGHMVLAGAVQRPKIGDGHRAYLGIHRDRIAAFGGRGLPPW
jgi:hypothetical protein